MPQTGKTGRAFPTLPWRDSLMALFGDAAADVPPRGVSLGSGRQAHGDDRPPLSRESAGPTRSGSPDPICHQVDMPLLCGSRRRGCGDPMASDGAGVAASRGWVQMPLDAGLLAQLQRTEAGWPRKLKLWCLGPCEIRAPGGRQTGSFRFNSVTCIDAICAAYSCTYCSIAKSGGRTPRRRPA